VDIRIVKRNIQIHRVIANELLVQFSRIWERVLTAEEKDVIESCTLCLSLMRLESILNGLSIITSPEKADENFAYIKSAVESSASEIVEILSSIPGVPREVINGGPSQNLLIFEEAVCHAIAAV